RDSLSGQYLLAAGIPVCQVLVEAEFWGMTGEGRLRHPSFKGVREDRVASVRSGALRNKPSESLLLYRVEDHAGDRVNVRKDLMRRRNGWACALGDNCLWELASSEACSQT